MKRLLVASALAMLPTSAWTDRTQVFSVQGFTCDGCETEIRSPLKRSKGVRKWAFDKAKYEYTLTLADEMNDAAVVALFEHEGYRAFVGPGKGEGPAAYKPEPYPEGADVVVLTHDGQRVGDLEKHRVAGKYTV